MERTEARWVGTRDRTERDVKWRFRHSRAGARPLGPHTEPSSFVAGRGRRHALISVGREGGLLWAHLSIFRRRPLQKYRIPIGLLRDRPYSLTEFSGRRDAFPGYFENPSGAASRPVLFYNTSSRASGALRSRLAIDLNGIVGRGALRP